LAGRTDVGGVPLVALDGRTSPPPGAIRYSTLHRFKGLEADVVLLCDFDGNPTTSTRRHLYVGASRAKHRLYVYASEGAGDPGCYA
jgi:superfamily I DNA/RNA helicase